VTDARCQQAFENASKGLFSAKVDEADRTKADDELDKDYSQRNKAVEDRRAKSMIRLNRLQRPFLWGATVGRRGQTRSTSPRSELILPRIPLFAESAIIFR
jgi:hypothetical protein